MAHKYYLLDKKTFFWGSILQLKGRASISSHYGNFYFSDRINKIPRINRNPINPVYPVKKSPAESG